MKEEAINFRNRFRILVGNHVDDKGNIVNEYMLGKRAAKAVALLAIENVLDSSNSPTRIEYWSKLKGEIENLKP